jgi:hypothetical protein
MLEPGEVVELSVTQYEAFKDRFDLITEKSAFDTAAEEKLQEPGILFAVHDGGNLHTVWNKETHKKFSANVLGLEELLETFPGIEIYEKNELPEEFRFVLNPAQAKLDRASRAKPVRSSKKGGMKRGK